MKKLIISMVLALTLLVSLAAPALAADPTVTITVSAKVISITNTQDTWAIGAIEVDDVVYFSADNTQDDDYSQIENTGNVAADIEIQGIDLDDATDAEYDWTLATTAASEAYSLYTNDDGDATYDTEVKSSSYTDIVTNLAAAATFDWSMKLTAPTAFDAADVGDTKTATVTLVASEHT